MAEVGPAGAGSKPAMTQTKGSEASTASSTIGKPPAGISPPGPHRPALASRPGGAPPPAQGDRLSTASAAQADRASSTSFGGRARGLPKEAEAKPLPKDPGLARGNLPAAPMGPARAGAKPGGFPLGLPGAPRPPVLPDRGGAAEAPGADKGPKPGPRMQRITLPGAASAERETKPGGPPPSSKRPAPPLRRGAPPVDPATLWAVSYSDEDDREMTMPAILAAVQAGEVTPDTIVWREGMPEWKPLGETAEFSPHLEAMGYAVGEVEPEDELLESLPAGSGPPRVDEEEQTLIFRPGLHDRPRAEEPTVVTPVSVADLAATLPDEPPESGESDELELEDLSPLLQPPGRTSGAEDAKGKPSTGDPGPRGAEVKGSPPAAAVPVRRSLPVSLYPDLHGNARYVVWGLAVLIVVGVVVAIIFMVRAVFADDEPSVSTAPYVPPQATSTASDAEQSNPLPASSGSTPGSGNLADLVSANVLRTAPAEGARFDEQQAKERLAAAASRSTMCRKPSDPKGPAKVVVTFEPATGRAKARVQGAYAGTDSAKCIELEMQVARVRPFVGEPVTITERVMLR